MTNNKRRIILKVVRYDNAVDAAFHHACAQFDLDSQFDGGEFSGPAIERDLQRKRERIAQRFGFATAKVARDVAELLNVDTVAYSCHQRMGDPLPLPD